MATSVVSINNLALQKLGAGRISSLTEDKETARACNACYEQMRRGELRKAKWKFAIKRVTLAPSATTPEFGYDNAFVLPADCLRPLFDVRLGLDWKVENHLGDQAILTNDGDTLELRYVADITDPTKFDPCFIEALACKIGWNICERVTGSNSKKTDMKEQYDLAMAEARRLNALEIGVQKQPVDEWLAARRTGQLVNSEWGNE